MSKLKKISIIIAWSIAFLLLGSYIILNAHWMFPRIWLSIRVLVGNFIFFLTNLQFPQVYDLIDTTVITVPGTIPIAIPETALNFVEKIRLFFALMTNRDYYGYVYSVTHQFLSNGVLYLQFIPFIAFAFYLIRRKYLSPSGLSVGHQSKSLRNFEKLLHGPVKTLKEWLRDFFLAKNVPKLKPKFFWPLRWLHELRYVRFLLIIMLAMAMNLFPVAIDLVSFYFAFFSFNPVIYYKFLYIFMFDLWPIISRIPIIAYVILAYYITWKIRWNAGLNNLRHQINYVVGWIKQSLGMITILVGPPNIGKTLTNSYLNLLTEMMLRNITLDMLNEIRHRFPDFPWRRLERYVEIGMNERGQGRIHNLVALEEFIEARKGKTGKGTKLMRTFGYDQWKYRTEFYDQLVNEDIWNALTDYSKLYFMYVFPKALSEANYRIRYDGVLFDEGEFPVWDFDFVTRDNRYKEIFSKYSIILDLDSLRPGRKVVPNNPKSNVIDMGVVSITELGKERPNMTETKYMKKDDPTANPLNDNFNAGMKMLRHGATVRHQMMVRLYGDEQGYESIPEDLRRLGQLVHLGYGQEVEWKLAMPLTWTIPYILQTIIDGFESFDIKYRRVRSDETLIHYLYKHLASWAYSKLKTIHNQMDYLEIRAEVTDGRAENAPRIQKIYLPKKVVYADRYNTDAMAGFFKERQRRSKYGLIELETFDNKPASMKQILKTHGYFVRWWNDQDKQEGTSVVQEKVKQPEDDMYI